MGGEKSFDPECHAFGLQPDTLTAVVVLLRHRCHAFAFVDTIMVSLVAENGRRRATQPLVVEQQEAWRLVEDRFLKRPLGREYMPLLDRPAADALERLKKRFGKGSGLSTIRNNYAFHHPGIDDIDAAFEKAAAEVNSEEADWAVYFNKALLNTSFFVSDYVFVHGMADALSEPDVNEAHRKLMGEMAPVANDLSEFEFGFAATIFKRHVGSELIMKIVAKVDDAPDIDDIRYPFFVETPGLRNP
jgi:fructose-specific component phosphotransferase system IIB-like protein